MSEGGETGQIDIVNDETHTDDETHSKPVDSDSQEPTRITSCHQRSPSSSMIFSERTQTTEPGMELQIYRGVTFDDLWF